MLMMTGIWICNVINDKPQHGYRCGVMRNDGGRDFSRISDRGLDLAIHGMGLAWGDLNLDGHIDFGVTGWSQMALLINDGFDSWYEASLTWGLLADFQRVVAWGIEFH